MLTLSAALDLFLLEDRARSTQDTYRKVLRRAINWLGPDRPIEHVVKDDILRYIQTLRNQDKKYAAHPRRPAESGALSPKTVEKHVKTISTFFTWLEENDHRVGNPTDHLKLRRYQRPPGVSKAATPEELKAILRVAEGKAATGKPLHLAVFLFLCDTGCRAGEAASLTIDNLLLDQGGAWVTGKGDKTRPVFFGDKTALAMRVWLDARPESSNRLVFGLTADSLSQVIARLAKRAGIKRNIGAHAIRHRVGQVWAGARMSEQMTQMKLGHDDPAVTMEMYYNTTWEHVKAASSELSLAAIYGVPTEPKILTAPESIWRRRTGS